MNFEITKINVYPIDGFYNCVAIVQLEINNCLRVTGIKLFKDPATQKYLVKYPKNASNKKNHCYFYPTNKETTIGMQEVIVQAYEEALMQTNIQEAE